MQKQNPRNGKIGEFQSQTNLLTQGTVKTEDNEFREDWCGFLDSRFRRKSQVRGRDGIFEVSEHVQMGGNSLEELQGSPQTACLKTHKTPNPMYGSILMAKEGGKSSKISQFVPNCASLALV